MVKTENLRPSEIERRRKLRLANIGKKLTEEHKKKIGLANKGKERSLEFRENMRKIMTGLRTGELNNMWKGDNVSNSGLHKWLRVYFPKPTLCHMCNEVPPTDVANLTGIYNREFKNWAWFCIKCHSHYDNRLARMIINRKYKNKIGRPKKIGIKMGGRN